MKIPGEYAKTFKTMQNKLKREFPKTKLKDPETLPENIIEVLLLGILSTNEKYSSALEALTKIRENMVDYNELRVTPRTEIAELLESHLSDPERMAGEIIKTLNEVFSRFDSLDLSWLKEKNKSEISELFKTLTGCSEHARCFMLLFSFEVSTMPLDEKMLDYLVSVETLPPEVDLPAAVSFLERQLKAAEIAPFYWQLRKAGEEGIKKKPRNKK